jgi:hypothetical protein
VSLDQTLSVFEPICLSEMDGYELMNRTDTKFVFPSKRLPDLLSKISKHYRILEINQKRDFPYSSTYLDTSDYLFFNQQMRGIPKRYKVRYRIYETTGQSYLEVKYKNIKDRTVKWRIKNQFDNCKPDTEALRFLSSYIQDTAYSIEPVLSNRFQRITLVGINSKERITFDHNIRFSDNGNSLIELPYLAIAELKRDGHSGQSPFLTTLKEMMIRRSGFSKYCIGSALLRAMPKANLIKPKMLLLQKIKNENVILIA